MGKGKRKMEKNIVIKIQKLKNKKGGKMKNKNKTCPLRSFLFVHLTPFACFCLLRKCSIETRLITMRSQPNYF